MPNARKLELTIRQQAMIVYALEGYADGEKISLYECGEIIDLIRLIQSADALFIEYKPGKSWSCKARAGVGANDPQDCDWPNCGCAP